MSAVERERMVTAEVVRLMRERFGAAVGELHAESSLAELGLDSVDVLDALASLERHFSISLDQEDLMGLDRLGDLVQLVCAELVRCGGT